MLTHVAMQLMGAGGGPRITGLSQIVLLTPECPTEPNVHVSFSTVGVSDTDEIRIYGHSAAEHAPPPGQSGLIHSGPAEFSGQASGTWARKESDEEDKEEGGDFRRVWVRAEIRRGGAVVASRETTPEVYFVDHPPSCVGDFD